MRNLIAATLAVVVGLVFANMLGVAAAEAPTTGTTAPVRTIGVEGVATVPVTQGANRATATAAYREGMATALADGQSKAEFLASKAGVTLSGVQSIAEGGGSISCTGGEESEYIEYTGEQPDFGSINESVSPIEAAAAPRAPAIRKPTAKHHKKHATAKKASVGGCTLSTQVSLTYAIS
jgi:hypothetical protein